MNRLEAYKQKHPNVRDQMIAEAIGCKRSYVTQLRKRSADGNPVPTPSLKVAVLLEAATGGAVPADSWVKIPKGITPLHDRTDKRG